MKARMISPNRIGSPLRKGVTKSQEVCNNYFAARDLSLKSLSLDSIACDGARCLKRESERWIMVEIENSQSLRFNGSA